MLCFYYYYFFIFHVFKEKLDEYDFRDEDAEITPIQHKLQPVKLEHSTSSGYAIIILKTILEKYHSI